MYYLRKEPYDGHEDRTVYKHHNFQRFYRGPFNGLKAKYQGMKVYTCKTLKRILELREGIHDYCGEWFDVYDENGKVDIEEAKAHGMA